MTEPHFDNAQELVDAFGIADNENYIDVTHLTDRKVGFSVQRKYPNDILYIPLVNREGDADTVSLIHVVYSHPTDEESEFNSHKVPLIIRISTHSKYRANHIDYDFDNPKSPTKESIERTKVSTTPIALDFYDEFFYDHHSGSFIGKDLEQLSGIEVLERVYQMHCETAHIKKGRGIRRKLHFQTTATALLAFVISTFTKALSVIFGRTLDDSDNYFAYLQGYDRKSLKKLSTESLDVFGYKASRRVIILFCFFVAISYAVKYRYGIPTPYLNSIFTDNFLALTHALIILWFLDVVAPLVLFYFINILIKIRRNVTFQKFKV